MKILTGLIKDVFLTRKAERVPEEMSSIKKVLNVGGGSKATAISDYFSGWQHDLLDIDPRGGPDIVCDARELATLPGGTYDAVSFTHGLQSEIENSGQNFYAHKTGFTPQSLKKMLVDGGFGKVFLSTSESLAVHALAFKTEPTPEQYALFEKSWNLRAASKAGQVEIPG